MKRVFAILDFHYTIAVVQQIDNNDIIAKCIEHLKSRSLECSEMESEKATGLTDDKGLVMPNIFAGLAIGYCLVCIINTISVFNCLISLLLAIVPILKCLKEINKSKFRKIYSLEAILKKISIE